MLILAKVFRVKFNFEQSYDVCGNGKSGFSVTRLTTYFSFYDFDFSTLN